MLDCTKIREAVEGGDVALKRRERPKGWNGSKKDDWYWRRWGKYGSVHYACAYCGRMDDYVKAGEEPSLHWEGCPKARQG